MDNTVNLSSSPQTFNPEVGMLLADVKWSSFPDSAPLSTSDYSVGLQAGINVKIPNSSLITLMNNNVQISESQVTNLGSSLSSKLDISGGVMSGFLTLNADPTLSLEAATKQYVDNSIITPTFQSVYNNSSPPSFNINSSGFQINDSLSNPLFGVFPSLVYMYSPIKFIMGNVSKSNYAVAQFNSTQYGILPPVLTNAQEGTLTSSLGTSDEGLQWFNSTNNIISYWDGLNKQDVLAIGNIIQGSNMTITDNGNGTVTLASSGGSSTSIQVQGSFNSSSPTTPTPVTNLDTPIAVSGASFNVVNAVGTNVSLATIMGVQTVIIENTSTGGRWCTINYDLSLLITANSNQTYGFTVYTNSGGIAFFKEFTVTGTAPLYKDFSITTPVIFLNTNDYVYLTVNSSLNTGPSFICYYFNGRLVDTTVANLPSTDSLSQGTSNLYLSQNGGTTYEFLSGSSTVGDIPTFSSTGGQLSDSGISATSILTTSSALGGALSGTLPNPTLSSSGIGQVIAITVTGTSQPITDISPVNRYVLQNTSLITLTLPLSPIVGHTIEIFGSSTGLWKIAQNAGQQIVTSVGGAFASTTLGVTGFVQSSNNTDCIILLYSGSGIFIIVSEMTSNTGIVLN